MLHAATPVLISTSSSPTQPAFPSAAAFYCVSVFTSCTRNLRLFFSFAFAPLFTNKATERLGLDGTLKPSPSRVEGRPARRGRPGPHATHRHNNSSGFTGSCLTSFNAYPRPTPTSFATSSPCHALLTHETKAGGSGASGSPSKDLLGKTTAGRSRPPRSPSSPAPTSPGPARASQAVSSGLSARRRGSAGRRALLSGPFVLPSPPFAGPARPRCRPPPPRGSPGARPGSQHTPPVTQEPHQRETAAPGRREAGGARADCKSRHAAEARSSTGRPLLDRGCSAPGDLVSYG